MNQAGENNSFTARLSSFQLRALHSLFPIFASRFLEATSPRLQGEKEVTDHVPATPAFSTDAQRSARLAWASGILGRQLESFSALASDEAARLIDVMKRALGQTITPARRRPGRDLAHAYGTAGRKSDSSNEIVMVDAPTLELLDQTLAQLGWPQQRLDSFLKSKRSPVRNGGAIRTLAQANRVIWALKNMLRHGKKQHGTKEGLSQRTLFGSSEIKNAG
jgi:hypothetical protein